MAETIDYTDLSQYPAGHFDQFFLFSSMYSDRLLTEFLPRVRNQAYERYMEIQKNILSDTEKHTTADQFEKDYTLSNMLKFPVNTRYWKIPGLELPIINQFRFNRMYGAGTIAIPGLDFYQHTDVFRQVFRLMVGDYYCDRYYIVKDKFGNMYVAIKDDANDGIPSDAFNSLDDAPVFLWRDKAAAVYQESLIPSVSITETDGKHTLKIHRTSTITPLSIPYNDNSWDICIAPNPTTLGNCLAYIAQATLLSVDADYLTFAIPDEFAAMASSISMGTRVTAIHRPNRRYSYKYTATSTEEPILYLAEEGNPIPASNIKLYTYDNTTGHRKHRISLEGISPKFFPAIYDFTSLVESDDLFIEIIDYDKAVTNTEFVNHLQILIDMLGSDDYRTSLVNGELSQHPDIVGFDPMNVQMSHKEFLASGYGIREYKLRKLIELMQTDPWIYQEYVKFMDKLNLRILSEAGTPKHFKLNTGLTRDGLSYPSGPVMMDTHDIVYVKRDNTTYFTEPHTYLKVHCENPDVYVRVFVNGSLIVPSAIESVGNDIYIFIAQSVFSTLLEPYTTDETLDISNSQLVIVEMFPQIDRNNANLLQDSKNWGTTGDFQGIFDDHDDIKVSVNDLLFVNSTSGEILDRSQFDFEFTLHEADLEYDDGTKHTIGGARDEILYLRTNAGELWLTKDGVPIILESHTEDVAPEFDDTGVPGTGAITSIEDILNKKYYLSDIKVAINDPLLIGTDITIIVARRALEWNIKSTDSDHLNVVDGEIHVNVKGFLANPKNKDMVEVYVNGTQLIKGYEIQLPTNTNDDVELVISKSTTSDILKCTTEYEVEIRCIPDGRVIENSAITPRMNKLTGDQMTLISTKMNVTNDDTVTLNGEFGKFICKWFDQTDKPNSAIEPGSLVNHVNADKFSRHFMKYGTTLSSGNKVRIKDIRRDVSIASLVPEWPINPELLLVDPP